MPVYSRVKCETTSTMSLSYIKPETTNTESNVSLCGSEVTEKSEVGSRGGHVSQCPIAGDANAFLNKDHNITSVLV